MDRPAWFPVEGPEFDEWARLAAHPRRNAAQLRQRGWTDTRLGSRSQQPAGRY